MRGAWIVIAATLASCVETNSVRCGDVTCPPSTHCGSNNECVPAACGNETVDDLEECDGPIDPTKLKCTDYGFYGGPPLLCADTCKVDLGACIGSCGDQEINGPERCDGIPPIGLSCADFGFDVGVLTCASGCTPGFELCSSLGWGTAPGGATDELRAVWLAGPASGIAVELRGTIVVATDGVWVPVDSKSTVDLYGVWGRTMTDVYAVGAGGVILHYDGTDWTPVESHTTNTLYAIAGFGVRAVAVGAAGTLVDFDGNGRRV